MPRFTYEEYMRKVEDGALGAPNLALELVEQETNNEVLVDALRAAQSELVALQSWWRIILAHDEPSQLETDLADAVALIKWLALPWADNEPYWPTTDGWTGQALAANERLQRSWRRFVRDNLPASPGEQATPGTVPRATTER